MLKLSGHIPETQPGDGPVDVTNTPSAESFKSAMRRFASSVAIVTAASGENRFGMTATAITAVTAQPPTILVCINRAASIHNVLHCGRDFCVNLLGSQHADLSQAFGGSVAAGERFDHGDWDTGRNGVPFLRDAQGSLFCSVSISMSYGSHTIFLGRVDRIVVHGNFDPLIYGNGRLISA